MHKADGEQSEVVEGEVKLRQLSQGGSSNRFLEQLHRTHPLNRCVELFDLVVTGFPTSC